MAKKEKGIKLDDWLEESKRMIKEIRRSELITAADLAIRIGPTWNWYDDDHQERIEASIKKIDRETVRAIARAAEIAVGGCSSKKK